MIVAIPSELVDKIIEWLKVIQDYGVDDYLKVEEDKKAQKLIKELNELKPYEADS